jgi:hypothetical protein
MTGFFGPRLQVLSGTEGDADNLGILVFEVLGSITEPNGLLRSIAAECAGIEPDQHVFSRIICEIHALAILIGQGECGCHASDLRQSHRLSSWLMTATVIKNNYSSLASGRKPVLSAQSLYTLRRRSVGVLPIVPSRPRPTPNLENRAAH